MDLISATTRFVLLPRRFLQTSSSANAGIGRACLRQLLPAITCLFLATPTLVRADYTARVQPGEVLVPGFEGWGTSLCWWANIIGGFPNREYYADLAFNELKLNIVRYNIGGGENPDILRTNNFMFDYATMQGFEPSPGVWDWSADANQRWMLKAALARG